MTLIKNFSDGSNIEYRQGKFDKWCVFISRPGSIAYSPTDIQYFTELQRLGNLFGKQKIYNDFVSIYKKTTKSIDPYVLNLISDMSQHYGVESLSFDITLSIIYSAMIAEENKANTKLGKRIKRLGIHQILIENMPIRTAANFSRNMKWFEINAECLKRGF